MAPERLQKLLARAGVASRRGAEALIVAGRVSVNGVRAEIGSSADPSSDRVEIDGSPVPVAGSAIYIALHKPAGHVSSAKDERGRPSVLRLVPASERLWPAGRLDVESEGLVLLTNDGEWAERILHPRYGIRREYAVLATRPPDAREVDSLLRGVELSDGPARLRSIRAADAPREVDPDPQGGAWLRVEVGEGRKREVRRVFAAVGIQVLRLVRTRFGTIELDGLRPGQWREIPPAAARALVASAEPMAVARS